MQHLTHVHFGTPGAFTDHSPAEVRLDQFVQGKRNFKFFNIWALNDQFLEVISNNWSPAVYGTPIYILCWRLKLLKGHLNELNCLHFSHILERVLRLEPEFEFYQSILQQDMDNQLIVERDRLHRSKLSNLKFAEK